MLGLHPPLEAEVVGPELLLGEVGEVGGAVLGGALGGVLEVPHLLGGLQHGRALHVAPEGPVAVLVLGPGAPTLPAPHLLW